MMQVQPLHMRSTHSTTFPPSLPPSLALSSLFPPSPLAFTQPLHSSLPLPPLLSPSPRGPTASDVYQTTTATTYDNIREEDGNEVQPPQYRKAPGHWRVNYTLEAISKV